MPWDWCAQQQTDDATIDMKPQAEPSTQEALAGLVERVTYHNAENGFCVLRAKAFGGGGRGPGRGGNGIGRGGGGSPGNPRVLGPMQGRSDD